MRFRIASLPTLIAAALRRRRCATPRPPPAQTPAPPPPVACAEYPSRAAAVAPQPIALRARAVFAPAAVADLEPLPRAGRRPVGPHRRGLRDPRPRRPAGREVGAVVRRRGPTTSRAWSSAAGATSITS